MQSKAPRTPTRDPRPDDADLRFAAVHENRSRAPITLGNGEPEERSATVRDDRDGTTG
jgi:hypothetical protein